MISGHLWGRQHYQSCQPTMVFPRSLLLRKGCKRLRNFAWTGENKGLRPLFLKQLHHLDCCLLAAIQSKIQSQSQAQTSGKWIWCPSQGQWGNDEQVQLPQLQQNLNRYFTSSTHSFTGPQRNHSWVSGSQGHPKKSGKVCKLFGSELTFYVWLQGFSHTTRAVLTSDLVWLPNCSFCSSHPPFYPLFLVWMCCRKSFNTKRLRFLDLIDSNS